MTRFQEWISERINGNSFGAGVCFLFFVSFLIDSLIVLLETSSTKNRADLRSKRRYLDAIKTNNEG